MAGIGGGLRSDGVDNTCGRHSARHLRILHVVRAGGYGTISSLAEIVPQLERQGTTGSVVILNDGRGGSATTRRKLDEAGVAFQEISIRRIRRWMRPKPLFWAGDVPHVVRRLSSAAEADILHCHGALPLVVGLLSRRRALVVTTFHGMTSCRSVSQRCFRAATGLADAVVALKEADARAIKRWSRPSQLHLAKNGVNVSRWQLKLAASRTLRGALGIPRDAFVVGVLSRLSREKGIEPFLVAVARSGWLTRADVHVVVVGAGPEEERLERLIGRQALAERTHFLGYRHDMGNVYRTLDALAVPSGTESQPMVVLEAMACRVPVVAFSVGSLPEMLADGAGILVPPGDYRALTDALDRLRVSSAMQASLVDTAHRQVSEKYDACTVARDLMQNVYLPLISQQRASKSAH